MQAWKRKTLKAILWTVVGFVLLFLIAAVLVQVPAIQNKIIRFATAFVGNKTHTKVEIKHVGISFPKSVVVEGLFLEDTQKDTLLYAGKAKVNIAIFALLSNKITIGSLALEDVNIKIKNTETDSLFNYNFLIAAFSDTTNQLNADTTTASKWTFSIDRVNMKNIRLDFNDEYGGTMLTANLKNLELKVDEMDLENSIYRIDDLLVESLDVDVLIQKITDSKESESVLPKISAKRIQIGNSTFNYVDSVGKLSVLSVINQFQTEDALVDFQNQQVILDLFSLSKSEIQYSSFITENAIDPIAVAPSKPTENNWKVSVNRIDLEDNSLAYKTGNKPETIGQFNADHLEYKRLFLYARDFSYSSYLTTVSVKKFSAVDQNNFPVTSFATDFRMDEHSISAKNLKATVANSSIDADLNIRYQSLETMMDSLASGTLNLDLKNVSIANPDILYFVSSLIEQPFFKNRTNSTSVSGIVNGPINDLSGKNLVIKTGIHTIVKTDFNVAGLPNFQTASFDIPNLKLISGKKDIEMLAGSYLPESIGLPENINLQISFKGHLNSFESTASMKSSFGDATLIASVDREENFSSTITTYGFDLGGLLKDKSMYGPVSLTAEATGQGFDSKTLKAKFKAGSSQFYLNKYTYHNLFLEGTVDGQELEGKINLKDENATFDLDGLVNLNPGQEQYKIRLNLAEADLQKLNISKSDVRIGLAATADFEGASVNSLNGKAKITNIVLAQEERKYALDSVLITAQNEPGKSSFDVNSDLVDITYSGTVFPTSLPAQLSQFVSVYFPFSDSIASNNDQLSDFDFKIQLHNHPLLSEVLFPELHEFEPGTIQGSFDSAKNDLKLNAEFSKTVYGTTEIKDFKVEVNSDSKALNFQLSCGNISNSQVGLDNFSMDGKLADNLISTTLSSIDEKKNKKLLVLSQISKEGANYKLVLDPSEFYLMDQRWDIAADNYIEFGEQGFLIHHLFMNNAERQVNIASVNEQFNDDLNIAIRNFKLDDISGLIEKDTGLLKGTVNGNVLLKSVNNSFGLIADATITDLFVSNVPIGNLTVKAENAATEKFNIDVELSGANNNLTARGYYIPNGGDRSIYIKMAIQALPLETVKVFSMGAITQASGKLTGNILVEGNTEAPEITGELVFDNAFITPAALNNRLELKHETFLLKKDGIYFNSFTILDVDQHAAIIDGAVTMNRFSDFKFALQVSTKDFLLFNTSSNDNKEFYGRMIIDSKIDIKGPMMFPVVTANLKLKKGSNFTFAVPENKLSTDKGEDVVEFESGAELNPILYKADKKEIEKTTLTGFNVSSIIEIDKQATLRLLLDPASTDSLVVKGEAALSFTIDQSGKMSLTGAYNLNDGSYLVSLESVIKRRFNIDRGSTIIWSGDLYDAEIAINATYSVRASPIDLMAGQMSGLSETDVNAYKQRYPFLVLLKLRGEMLHPEISFEIQLPPEEKGILSGAVNQKLTLLNEDASALNKQVFALLVLGRFIQENPLQSESSGASTIARATVGKFLSQQLNQWSSKVVSGVDLNFDIQSYNDYQSGQAEGRTQVDIGLQKQLFNERLSIQLGGTVDVEGDQAKQNSASDITSDVTVEYKLTQDGRYRLKGFRHNQYEGVIEGQLVETGIGIIYVRDFDKWKEFLKSPKRKSDSSEKENNGTDNPK